MRSKPFARMHVWPLTEQVQSRDAFVYIDRGMQVAGWIPPAKKLARRIYFLWTVITTVMVIILLDVSLLMSYFKDFRRFNAGQFLTSLQVGLNCFGSSIKACYTFAGIKRFSRAKQLLDRMDQRCTSDEQRLHMHRWVARCNQVYMYFQVMYSFYALSTFLAGALSGQLAWRMYNPLIDAEASKQHFWLAAILEYVWMSGAVFQDQMADSYPIIYFLMLRAHITLLKQRLRRLRTNTKLTEKQNYAELINCIGDHRLILEYCSTLAPVVSATIFVQFLLVGIVMGLTVINIMFFASFWTGLGAAIFLFDVIMQTFPFCYICNLIMDDSQELAYCLFHSNWLDADRRYRHTLRHFLHNVQQPIIMTAGGVFIISMSTNVSVT
ncbi:Or85a [Drosophila busckii]|uniref:Odorant receptor n=1 Tax=Drosophila busckii TaxID=30019 RepID=A0A0M4EMZ9_DROBS|nr:Or85a [Drosophila busckii]